MQELQISRFEVWGFCKGCGGDIYPGEFIWKLPNGTFVHDDMDCMCKYTGAIEWTY